MYVCTPSSSGGLLELHGRIALEDEEVVVAKCLRRIFWQGFPFHLSDDVGEALMEETLPLPVDEQQPAFDVLDVDDGGGVVEDLLQASFAVLQLALHAGALGDLAEPGLCFGNVRRIEGATSRRVTLPLRPLRAVRSPRELLRCTSAPCGGRRRWNTSHPSASAFTQPGQ
jgi:hypothetical protein